MAKDAKKTTAFGTSPHSFNESRRRQSVPETDKHTHDYTHNDTQVREPQARERKTKRVQILTYESLVSRMDNYANRKGVSRADVFEAAVEAFLEAVEE